LAFAIFAVIAWAQPPTIRVPVRLVTAPTLVFNGDDRLVFGLEQRHFQVFDNGQPQRAALDTDYAPVSIALAVQANQDIRSYTRFIAKVGSAVEALLVGENGEGAVIAYNADIKLLKPFDSGDVQLAMQKIVGSGRRARAIDAGMRAIKLLEERPRSRARVLIFIGQPMDDGSESPIAALREEAEREGVAIHVLALPIAGKDFVSDTLTLDGLPRERGGFRAGADLTRLIPVLARNAAAQTRTDPFSSLTAATGGTQFHIRTQRELENGIALIGVELRSAYVLSYTPPAERGYHSIRVDVAVPGAKVYSRPGYRMN
jgi:VWFA-related protein